jgi:hypothetical protein
VSSSRRDHQELQFRELTVQKDAAQWLSGGGLLRVRSGLGALARVQHASALESLAESSAGAS